MPTASAHVQSFFVGSKTLFVQKYPDIALRIFKASSVQNIKHFETNIRNADTSTHVLYIPAQQKYDTPLDLNATIAAHIHTTDAHTSPLHPGIRKIVVILDHGASIHLIDTVDTTNTTGLALDPIISRIIEYWVGDYAQLNVTYDQRYATTTTEQTVIDCYASSHSAITVQCIISGSAQSTSILNLYAQGSYAHIQVRGAYLLGANQKASINVYQKHIVPHTQSSVTIKSILTDNAKLLYKGLIYIDKNAAHTDAVQENKNMLLGTDAQAHSLPNLEILTNEVRCAHGSAIGHIDDDHAFYMQSRGLAKQKAVQLLAHGFIAELFDKETYVLAQQRISRLLS